MRTRTLVLVLLTAGVALAAQAGATEVAFNKASLTFTANGAAQTVGIVVKGLPGSVSLAFASFQLAWNTAALEVSSVAWDTKVLDAAGAATPMAGGLNLSAARIKATGAVSAARPLLTLKVKPKAGKTGSFPISLKRSPLTTLLNPVGATIAVAKWGSLPVKVTAASKAVAATLTVQATKGGTAVLTYSLAAPASVSAEVRNIAGRRVRRIVTAREETSGAHELSWNLCSDQGSAVPSGTYLVLLTVRAQDGQQSRLVRTVAVKR